MEATFVLKPEGADKTIIACVDEAIEHFGTSVIYTETFTDSTVRQLTHVFIREDKARLYLVYKVGNEFEMIGLKVSMPGTYRLSEVELFRRLDVLKSEKGYCLSINGVMTPMPSKILPLKKAMKDLGSIIKPTPAQKVYEGETLLSEVLIKNLFFKIFEMRLNKFGSKALTLDFYGTNEQKIPDPEEGTFKLLFQSRNAAGPFDDGRIKISRVEETSINIAGFMALANKPRLADLEVPYPVMRVWTDYDALQVWIEVSDPINGRKIVGFQASCKEAVQILAVHAASSSMPMWCSVAECKQGRIVSLPLDGNPEMDSLLELKLMNEDEVLKAIEKIAHDQHARQKKPVVDANSIIPTVLYFNIERFCREYFRISIDECGVGGFANLVAQGVIPVASLREDGETLYFVDFHTSNSLNPKPPFTNYISEGIRAGLGATLRKQFGSWPASAQRPFLKLAETVDIVRIFFNEEGRIRKQNPITISEF